MMERTGVKTKGTLLGGFEEFAVGRDAGVELDDSCVGHDLYNHVGGDQGRDSELHEGTLVGGEDNSHPVERISSRGLVDSEDRNLAAHQVDEQHDSCPQGTFREAVVALGFLDSGHQGEDGAHHVKESSAHFVVVFRKV